MRLKAVSTDVEATTSAMDARHDGSAATYASPVGTRRQWRDALLAFATPFAAESTQRVLDRLQIEIDAGRLSWPLPHLATLHRWLHPHRKGIAKRDRLTAASNVSQEMARAVSMCEPPVDASEHELRQHIAALLRLVDAVRQTARLGGRITPELKERFTKERRLSLKALQETSTPRRHVWDAKALRIRLACLHRFLAEMNAQHTPTPPSTRVAPAAWQSADEQNGAAQPQIVPAEAPSDATVPRQSIYARPPGMTPPQGWGCSGATTVRPPFGSVLYTGRVPQQVADALVRAQIVVPLVNGTPGLSCRKLALAWRRTIRGDPCSGSEDDQLWLPQLDEEHRIRYRNISGHQIALWVKKIERAAAEAKACNKSIDIIEALMHRTPLHVRRVRVLTDSRREEALHLFTTHKEWSATDVAEHFRDRGVAVSDRTVQRAIAKYLLDKVRAAARGGPAADDVLFRQRIMRQAPYPNRAWIMDHSFFTNELWDPQHPEWLDGRCDFDFEFEFALLQASIGSTGRLRRASRMCMTMIIDACTRYILALRVWDGPPCTERTLLALRDAIERFGRPEFLYTDNGSDLKSKRVRNALAMAKIFHVLSRPYCPEGRGIIERPFRTIKEKILINLPGFLGGRHPRRAEDRELKTTQELERLIFDYVDRRMNKRIHGTTGRAPVEHYFTEIGARGLPDPDPAALVALLCENTEVVVDKNGIHANGRLYVGPGTTGLLRGLKVSLLSDPYYPRVGHVYAPDSNGMMRYIGWVESPDQGEAMPEHDEWQALEAQWDKDRSAEVEMTRRQREQEAHLRQVAASGNAEAARLVDAVESELIVLDPPARRLAIPRARPADRETTEIDRRKSDSNHGNQSQAEQRPTESTGESSDRRRRAVLLPWE